MYSLPIERARVGIPLYQFYRKEKNKVLLFLTESSTKEKQLTLTRRTQVFPEVKQSLTVQHDSYRPL